MFSVSKHMLRNKGVRTTYYDKNLILDTDNIIHKKFIKNKHDDNDPRSEHTFYKELQALQILEKNFINKPEIDHYPFPRVISYEDTNECIISMNFCGINAIENACLYSEKRNITPVNYYKTIECIINNLKINLIEYRDWKADNVCINSNGQISLIDFGRFRYVTKERLDRLYKVPDFNEIEEMLYTYVNCTKSDFLMEKALSRDEDGRCKWKNKFFKRNPWGLLYYF